MTEFLLLKITKLITIVLKKGNEVKKISANQFDKTTNSLFEAIRPFSFRNTVSNDF